MAYVCWKCKRKFEAADLVNVIRCPYCGSKVLFKETQAVMHKVSSD